MKKRCKRKIWSTVNPIAHAIAGAAIIDDKSLAQLQTGELSAIDSMTRGLGTVQDWKTMVDMMNIAEMMGRSGIGAEVLPYCEKMAVAMKEAAHRYEKTQKMGLSGEGINAARDVYEYHNLQRTSISRSVYERMIEKTRRALINRTPNVVELV